MINNSVNIGGIKLKNPVLTASGTCGYGEELAGIYDLNELGGIMVKGTSLKPWSGNAMPRIAETAAGMLNCVGLQNPGLDYLVEHYLPWLRQYNLAIIINIAGHSVEDYAKIAEALSDEPGIAGLEINISCPNVKAGGLAYGTDPKMANDVVSAVRKRTNLPLIAKLSPNVTDICEIASAVAEAGADAVSLINTVLGMAIDIDTRRPLLANNVGGLSGPAIKPIAIRMVWQVAQTIDLPIIGMGGITSWQDAIEFIMAGANAVAIGSGTFIRPDLPIIIAEGMSAWLEKENLTDWQQAVGTVRPY